MHLEFPFSICSYGVCSDNFTFTLRCNRGDLLHPLKGYFNCPPINFRRGEKDNIIYASINIVQSYHVVTGGGTHTSGFLHHSKETVKNLAGIILLHQTLTQRFLIFNYWPWSFTLDSILLHILDIIQFRILKL